MLKMESRLRTWGRSVGLVIPKKLVSRERLMPGDVIKLMLVKKTNALKETFGKFKLKRSTNEILREMDEAGWRE